MELNQAKEFFLFDTCNTENVYISKTLETLIDMNEGELYGIYAVCDTPSGEKLFEVDYSYTGEIFVTSRTLTHKAFIMKYYKTRIKRV